MGDIGRIVKSLSFIEEFVAVTGSLSTERDILGLLDKVLHSARRFTHCDGGRIYMLDVTRRYLQLKVSVWQDLEFAQDSSQGLTQNNESPQAKGSVQARLAARDYGDRWFEDLQIAGAEAAGSSQTATDPLIYAVLTGNAVIVDNIREAGRLACERYHLHDQLNGVNTHSFILVPLINHQAETIGVLELINARDFKYRRCISFRSIEPVIKAFASQAAICINNALLIDNNQKLIEILDSSNRELVEENRRLRQQRSRGNDYQIIGSSEPMKKVFSLMDKVVDSDVTVLLRGETGTGKEVFARAIHQHSSRSRRPFVTQNCAALPEHLLESELFGYKKGAFTGAATEKKGLLDVADGGTLFLDEIGDMPLNLQSKLLRVIQESEVRALGATESHKVDVRIIAATHCDLEAKIAAGEFREDLFFRLSVFPLELPALRVRGSDIIDLAEYFLAQCDKQYHRDVRGLSPAVVELLMNHRYPGNVRELQNIIERAVLLCEPRGTLLPEHLPLELGKGASHLLAREHSGKSCGDVNTLSILEKKPLKQAVNDFECEVIKQHLQHHNWNQTQAAKALQIPRRTLIDKMNRFNIKTPERRYRSA